MIPPHDCDLANIIVAVPLKKVDLFEQLLLVVLELTHRVEYADLEDCRVAQRRNSAEGVRRRLSFRPALLPVAAGPGGLSPGERVGKTS
jgi:hypothetical protein